jgi:hypothetical protein
MQAIMTGFGKRGNKRKLSVTAFIFMLMHR